MERLDQRPLVATTINSVEGLYAIRAKWDSLCARARCGSAFQTPSWVLAKLGDSTAPPIHVVAVHRGLLLVGLALLKPDPRGGLTFIGSPLNDENTFLLEEDECAAVILDHLAAEGRFDRLAAAPSESLGALLLSKTSCLSSSDEASASGGDTEPAARLALPSRWDQYLNSLPSLRRKRLRYVLSRATRERLSEFHVAASLSAVRSDVEEMLGLREASMRQRGLWQRCPVEARGAGFASFVCRLFETAAPRGFEPMLAMLRQDGKTVAAGLYLCFQTSVMKYCHGWQPALRTISPGTALDLRMIEWCIQSGFQTFDLGRGDEPYKFQLGAIPITLSSIAIDLQSPRNQKEVARSGPG